MLYRDEQVQKDSEEFEYYGLCRSYYSDDLQMVRKELDKGNLNPDLLNYITALNCEMEDRNDIVNNSSIESPLIINKLHEILHISNSPLGKWPSKFMPCFMQQVAIIYL